jgi:hypothetical protein
MLSWHSTDRRGGIQVVSDDGRWTIRMVQPLTLDWNLLLNVERQAISFEQLHSQHQRLDQAMRAAQEAQDELDDASP